MMRMQTQFRSLNTGLTLAVLLCLLLLLNFSSTGIVRNGGDDEDGGSGIGGTGRQAIPGSEGGIGGTGIKPFLGYSAQEDSQGISEVRILLRPEADLKPVIADLAIPHDSEPPKLTSPLPRRFEVSRPEQITRDSGAIDIAEAIQLDIDANALMIESGSAYLETRTSPAESHAANTGLPLSWGSLAKSMERASRQSIDSLNAGVVNAAETEIGGDQRASRPDRIQRPLLPPLQRVRPIQRAGLLPPPVRPLRL
jgi:hypothetical protein